MCKAAGAAGREKAHGVELPRWKDDVRPQFQPDEQNILSQTAIFQSALDRNIGPDVTGTVDQLDNIPIDEVSELKELAIPWFSDQILPFDITLAGTNTFVPADHPSSSWAAHTFLARAVRRRPESRG